MDIRQAAIATLLLVAGYQALTHPTQQSAAYSTDRIESTQQLQPPQSKPAEFSDFQQSNIKPNSKWQWPTLDGQPRRINSGFGYRSNPVFPEQGEQFHSGIDLHMPYGDGITAARSGRVIASGIFNKGCGIGVVIEHEDGYSSTYCHMSKVWARQGIQVNQGDTIGLVGSTGYSTGPHLHFSVKLPAQQGEWIGEAIDPMEVLP